MAVNILKKYEALNSKQIKDEQDRIQQLISNGEYPSIFKMPIVMQFELTARCNVYCKHCYNDSGNNRADRMTPEKWIEFSRYLVEHGGIFECILSGGEPLLLGNKLFDIMDTLHDDGTEFLLITNGYLLDKEKVNTLKKYDYRWLQVSIDGSESSYHDEFRQRQGSWEKATNGAFLASSAGIPVTIAHSVSPYNLDKIDEMCELAYSLGASSIMLGEINLSGRAAQNSDLLLNDEQREILLTKYEENSAKYAGRMIVQRSSSTKHSVMRYLNTPNTGLIVRPNGDLRLDCMVPFVIGNVLEDDFHEIWCNKGINCWNDKKVLEYISKFKESDSNEMLTNYVDEDIHI